MELSPQISQEDIDAVISRVAIAHGLSVEGDHPCLTFSEASLVDVEAAPDDVVLCSVGPLRGLDRLAADQVLKFALDGITVIFGDNGTGKSGYTRAMRQLTRVRQEAILEGNVFAPAPRPEKSITYTYSQKEKEPSSEIWREGEQKPAVLAGITLLDTDNLRVYVNGKNDILYMPPEAACVGRLAELYQAAAGRFTSEIGITTRQCSSPFGGGYNAGSSAPALVEKLALGTSEADLPTEKELRQNATWTDDDLAELNRLRAELSQGPGAQAAACDRIASACETATIAIEANHAPLLDSAMAGDAALIEAQLTKRRAADALVAEQIGSQPIGATGSDAWQGLFRIARQFAAQAGVRALDEPFAEGDACPLCQQALGEDAAKRLAAFDTYVEGAAVRDAEQAENAVARRLQTLRSLTFKSAEELQSLLGEAATRGPEAEALVADVIGYSDGLRARRVARVAQLEASLLTDLAPLPVTSLDHTRIRRVARRLVDEAAKGRQIIIFTHNLVFYHELMLACTDRSSPVPALPCLIEQSGEAEFGLVSVDSAPWLARKVKEREQTLKGLIDAVPDELATTSDEYRRACTRFYAALRETWERAVEEIVLNDVVRRFGSNVGTLRLGGVDVSDEDYSTVHRAMSRASEHSGHDQAAARQIDMPTKKQMQTDLNGLIEFRATKTRSNKVAADRRKAQAENPPKAATA